MLICLAAVSIYRHTMANPVLAFMLPLIPFIGKSFYTNKRPITFCPPLLSYTKTHQRLLSFMSPGIPWQSIPLSSVSVIIPCEYLNTIMWIETHQSYLEPSFMLVSFVNILRPWCDEWSTVIHMALGHTLRFNWKNYMSLKTKGYHITCNYTTIICECHNTMTEYLNTIMWIEAHQSYLEPSFMLVSFVSFLQPWCDEWSAVIWCIVQENQPRSNTDLVEILILTCHLLIYMIKRRTLNTFRGSAD